MYSGFIERDQQHELGYWRRVVVSALALSKEVSNIFQMSLLQMC